MLWEKDGFPIERLDETQPNIQIFPRTICDADVVKGSEFIVCVCVCVLCDSAVSLTFSENSALNKLYIIIIIIKGGSHPYYQIDQPA